MPSQSWFPQGLALSKLKHPKWWHCTAMHSEMISWGFNLTSSWHDPVTLDDCPTPSNILFLSTHTPYIFAPVSRQEWNTPPCSHFPGEKVTTTIPVSNFCFFFLSSLSWLISRWPTGKAVILVLEAETALLMFWDLSVFNFSMLLGKDLFRTISKHLIRKQLHYILENTILGNKLISREGGIVLAPLIPEPRC